MEIFDVEIGIITPAPDFYIKLALDYDKELKRFAKRMPELLDFYEKEFDKIFHGSLRILSLERGSVALCKQTNTRNALETIVKLNRALPIMNKKGRKASVAEIVYLEKGIQRRLTTENEFKAALYALSLEDNLDVPQLTQPKEHENQEFSTHNGRPEPTLEVEDDLDRKFIAAMDINQFQRTDITAYPIGVQSFLETISAKVERGAPLNEFEEYEQARYVQTRRAVVHAWRKYLNLKSEERPPCPEQISTSVMLFWREQKRMAQVPLTPEDFLFLKKINDKNNTHMVNKGYLEVVSFFKEHGLDAPNRELTLLSLLPPRDRCEIWRQLLPSFPALKVLYQKYALALMKDNRLEEATRVLDEGASKHVLNNNERLECLTALQSVKMGIEVGNAPRPATSYQQTLQRLVTIFAAYKRLPFYQLLIDYCKRNGAQDVLHN